MQQCSLNQRLPETAPRRGDAAKVIIITVCVFVMIMVLLCAGLGVYGYVLFQRNFGRAIVQAPADVQKVATEITDIDIPAQFTPIMGSAIFGMKSVNYAWNPKGVPLTMTTWNNSHDPVVAMLHLMEVASESQTVTDKDFEINAYQKKALKSQYVEFTENVQEFTIRGRKCQFLFVTGHPREGAFEDEDEDVLYDEADEEEMTAEETPTTETAPIAAEDKPAAIAPTEPPVVPPADATGEAPKPAEPAAKVLPAIRSVTGQFPGKSGPTTITIRVPVEGSEDDLLLRIIQSLH